MKKLKLICLAVLGLGALASCETVEPAADPSATVQSHFFPLDNGLIYTYGRYNQSLGTNDTVSYRLLVTPYAESRLVSTLPTTKDSLLYNVSLSKDANGNPAAILATANYRLYALDGDLQVGSQWRADAVNRITAMVVGHYDSYFLQGRNTQYSDVIVVKYHQDNVPENIYTLRYFGRDKGLILERQMIGPSTEIASLQLLSVHRPLEIRSIISSPFNAVIFVPDQKN